MRFVAGWGAAGGMERSGSLCGRGCHYAEAGVAPSGRGCRYAAERSAPRQEIRLRDRRFCSAAGSSEMVILNLLVCWREPVVYHSVYVLLNDGFEEGILLGQ